MKNRIEQELNLEMASGLHWALLISAVSAQLAQFANRGSALLIVATSLCIIYLAICLVVINRRLIRIRLEGRPITTIALEDGRYRVIAAAVMYSDEHFQLVARNDSHHEVYAVKSKERLPAHFRIEKGGLPAFAVVSDSSSSASNENSSS